MGELALARAGRPAVGSGRGHRTRHRRRPVGVLTAGLFGVATLTGCGSEVAGSASPPVSVSSPAPAPTSGSAAGPEDLTAGLLPAEAFGPGTQVTPITGAQLLAQQGQLGGGLGELADLTVTPEECAPAVAGVQPGLDDVTGLAAQTADRQHRRRRGDRGGPVGGRLARRPRPEPGGLSAGHDHRTADRHRHGHLHPLEVPDLGDGSAALTMSLSLTGPDGSPLTVPVQLGMVLDGDRLVSLTVTDATGGEDQDPAASAQLLQRAYDHQHTALA